QWLERAANSAGVAARQVRGDDGFIDLRHSPVITRDDPRRPFLRAGKQRGARQGERDWSRRPRQCSPLGAIAVATSDVAALVGSRPERGSQLLVYGRLNGESDVLVDQLTQ